MRPCGEYVPQGCAGPRGGLTVRASQRDGAGGARPGVDGVVVAAADASPLGVFGSGPLSAYWRFHRAVARAQLASWLPPPRRLLVDISGPWSGAAAQAAAAGHRVARVVPASPAEPAAVAPLGGLATVVADTAGLAFLADGCADGVLAENGALSRHLMAEDLTAEIARVLRPGGRLLASVDSLVLGLAILAEQRHWAHLTDVPHAEVVLIPWPDGVITRVYGPEQLRDLLTEAGLEVAWIRPRTVLSPSAVDHVLRRDPGAIGRLVRAELGAGMHESARAHGDQSFGISLLAAARKPAGRRPSASGGGSRRPACHRPTRGRPADRAVAPLLERYPLGYYRSILL